MTKVANAIWNKWKAFALTLCVGVMPFFVAKSEATEKRIDSTTIASTTERIDSTAIAPIKEKTRWLDDYPKRIGLTCSADANLVANYIWRGQYVGGLSLQASARVNYEGLFADMWWNIGATDWVFSGFNPEVDIAVGFDRWGLQLYWLHMHYFDGTPFSAMPMQPPGRRATPANLGQDTPLAVRFR